MNYRRLKEHNILAIPSHLCGFETVTFKRKNVRRL